MLIKIDLLLETADVCNKDPLFGGSTTGGYSGLGVCPTTIDTSTDSEDAIYKFYGRNGSVDNATQASNGEVYLDVTFELVSVIDASGGEIPNAFELSNSTTWNQSTGEPPSVELFRVSSFLQSGFYSLVVDVIDADGARVTCQFVVEILAQGCYCKQFIRGNGLNQTYTMCDGSTGTVTFAQTDLPGFKKYRCARSETAGQICEPIPGVPASDEPCG
jgi:hypothetical protein